MQHRRAVALVVTLVVGMLALPAGDAAARSSPLQLDPSSGPAGTSIRVTTIFKTPGGCTASWDGQPRGSFPCGPDANGVLGWTTLTAQGPPGLHTVTVCQPSCDDVDSPSVESTSFTVLAVVPDLGSLSLADAGQRLERAGLVLGTVQGPSGDPAAQVSSQAPLPGAAVGAGSAVNVTMTLPGPVPVTVPDLVGRTQAEAAALVSAKQLVLRVASGTGRVQRQDPLPGSDVAPGSVVTVTLQAPPTQVLVAVPDVRGRTAGDAETAVAAAGLVLRATGPPAGTVQAQAPAPGTRVRRGSSVAVTLAVVGPPSTTTPPPAPGGAAGLAIGLVLLAVAVVLGALAARMLRRAPRRRSPQWVHEHVRVTAGANPAQPGDTQVEEAGPGPTRSIGLEPHRDRGSKTLEEVKR